MLCLRKVSPFFCHRFRSAICDYAILATFLLRRFRKPVGSFFFFRERALSASDHHDVQFDSSLPFPSLAGQAGWLVCAVLLLVRGRKKNHIRRLQAKCSNFFSIFVKFISVLKKHSNCVRLVRFSCKPVNEFGIRVKSVRQKGEKCFKGVLKTCWCPPHSGPPTVCVR